jgi:Xaa-Pro aminopeptidase
VTLSIAALRVVKSPAEIERIRQAIAITVEGQRAAQAVLARGAGRWEYEVEAAVLEAFRSRGATLAFPCIVGAGARGTVLHYEANSGQMQYEEMVVVDIGARFGHYCGDITRAYPVGGEFTQRQRDIYNLVLDVQKRLVLSYKPGEDTLQTLKDRCKELFKASPLRARDASGNEQTMENFLPHGISHHLGLDVHDMGDSEPPLSPGNVITIEPGLYLPGESIGVRLEDDYLVTPTGLERLGPPLEKNPDVVQAAMRPM